MLKILARVSLLPRRERYSKKKIVYTYGLDYLGPGYRLDSVFDLSKMQPYNLNDLLDLFLSLTDDVILYLPRTSDLRQIAARAQGGEDEKMTVMHYCMEGASKVCLPKTPANDFNKWEKRKNENHFLAAG